MKKVLIIAHYFPPAGGVGTFRVTKFVKYLREFGWEPVVLTVRENYYPNNVWLDHGLEKDIPEGVKIYRTKVWHTRIINDEGIRWLPFLLSAVVKVIREEHPDLVYFTGGPFFPLITGPLIRFLFRLPYVVDLRDPWKLAKRVLPARGIKTHLGHLLSNMAEPFVLRHAAKVICVTGRMCEEYKQEYSGFVDKFVLITNGYDPNDFKGIIPKQYNEFTIVYTGKFRRSEAFHNPATLFQAMKILRQRGIRVRFIHVGAREEEVIRLAESAGVKEDVEFTGAKPHDEALSYAMGGNLLLALGSNRKMGLPVKMFDYMGCRKPWLAIGCKGEEMLAVAAEIPHAIVLEDPNPQTIATAVEGVYSGRQKMARGKSIEEKYHRRNLTAILAGVLNSILMEEKPSSHAQPE